MWVTVPWRECAIHPPVAVAGMCTCVSSIYMHMTVLGRAGESQTTDYS